MWRARPVSIAGITAPAFIVSAEADWVAPWRSVYKYLLLNGSDTTFTLASGGHNGGIVSVPGAPHRHYRMLYRAAGAAYQAPDDWMTSAKPVEGSWWEAYSQFLDKHSSASGAPPPLPEMPQAAIRRWNPRPANMCCSAERAPWTASTPQSPRSKTAFSMTSPIGDQASVSRRIRAEDIELFSIISGDINPAHLDPDFAATDMFHHIISQGVLTAGLISAVLGTKLPGPGTIYLGQDLPVPRAGQPPATRLPPQ